MHMIKNPDKQSTSIDISWPYWQDYRCLLRQLFSQPESASEFACPNLPGTDQLNALMTVPAVTHSNRPVRFVPADTLPANAYEQHIFNSGEISTRKDNWHDVFNALVWARFSQTKLAMNALHNAEIKAASKTSRGPVRDALTLFDECGVVVIADQEPPLQAMLERDWETLFLTLRSSWQKHIRVFVFGHALLEKFLQPYKSITAQALVYSCPSGFMQLDRSTQRRLLDDSLAGQINTGRRLRSSAELSPLPLMGIPGWQSEGLQDEVYYADKKVFRAPAPGHQPAPLLSIE